MTPANEAGRLAMRVEGNYWNAYFALPGTMDDALFLGGIAMAAVTGHPERKAAFMGLMQDAVADILEQASGTRPTWNEPQAAPEHERAGRA